VAVENINGSSNRWKLLILSNIVTIKNKLMM